MCFLLFLPKYTVYIVCKYFFSYRFSLLFVIFNPLYASVWNYLRYIRLRQYVEWENWMKIFSAYWELSLPSFTISLNPKKVLRITFWRWQKTCREGDTARRRNETENLATENKANQAWKYCVCVAFLSFHSFVSIIISRAWTAANFRFYQISS